MINILFKLKIVNLKLQQQREEICKII